MLPVLIKTKPFNIYLNRLEWVRKKKKKTHHPVCFVVYRDITGHDILYRSLLVNVVLIIKKLKDTQDTLINTIYLFYPEIFCIYEHSYGCVHTQNEAKSCCNVGTTSFPFEHRWYHFIFKQKASCNTPKPKHDITTVLDS